MKTLVFIWLVSSVGLAQGFINLGRVVSQSPLVTMERRRQFLASVAVVVERPCHEVPSEHIGVLATGGMQDETLAKLRDGRIPCFVWPNAVTQPAQTDRDQVRQTLRAARDSDLQRVPDIWAALATHCPRLPALVDSPLTLSFSQVQALVRQVAAGLHALGVQPGQTLAMFAENSARWLLLEQGCALHGCPTAVRGATAPLDELAYIYGHSDSAVLVVQDPALLMKLHKQGWVSSTHGPPRLVVLLSTDMKDLEQLCLKVGCPVVSVEDVLAAGGHQIASAGYTPSARGPRDLYTIVYTSGTTGRPKGVMLTHGNILHQVKHISLDGTDNCNPGPGDTVLSLLPCWHIFERTSELFALSRGAHLVYSAIRTFKSDLQTYSPHFLIVVPRLLEVVHKGIKDKFAAQSAVKRRLVTVLSAVCVLYRRCLRAVRGLVLRHERRKRKQIARIGALVLSVFLWPLAKLADNFLWVKIRTGLGGRVKLIISGGSALAGYLEEFYEAAQIPVVSGYGLTESSPVIAVRRVDANLAEAGVVGQPPALVQIKVVDPESMVELTPGRPGLVLTKGPHVMAGYLKDAAATSKVMSDDGWLNTGDVGFINPGKGPLILCLTGRAKDTIVLSNGENIEPGPIEDVILERCPLVEQVMLVGQDRRSLGALAVVSPMELGRRGIITEAEAMRLSDLVGPTALTTGCKASSEELLSETMALNSNKRVAQEVMKEITAALNAEEEEFRTWEKVQHVAVLLEPFTIPSGLLTQTFKMRRNVVAEKYAKLVKGMYQ